MNSCECSCGLKKLYAICVTGYNVLCELIELIVGFIHFLFGLFFFCWSSSFWDKCVEIFTYNCWFSYFLVIKKYIYISRLHTYMYSWLSYLTEVMFFLPVYDVPLFPCIFHHKFYNLLYFLCSWYIYHSIIIIIIF